MTVVVDAADEDAEGDGSRNPFDGDRIEIDKRELSRISPDAWIGRLTTRLNERIRGLIWGR
jgi:hypothetical protein